MPAVADTAGGVCMCTQYHQYQVVGRHAPTEADASPKVYRMKLWALDACRARSKFWCVAIYPHPHPSPLAAPITSPSFHPSHPVDAHRRTSLHPRETSPILQRRTWRVQKSRVTADHNTLLQLEMPAEEVDPESHRLQLSLTLPQLCLCRYFMSLLKKVKKSNGQIIACNEIFERKPTTVKNFGIWIRAQVQHPSPSTSHSILQRISTDTSAPAGRRCEAVQAPVPCNDVCPWLVVGSSLHFKSFHPRLGTYISGALDGLW